MTETPDTSASRPTAAEKRAAALAASAAKAAPAAAPTGAQSAVAADAAQPTTTAPTTTTPPAATPQTATAPSAPSAAGAPPSAGAPAAVKTEPGASRRPVGVIAAIAVAALVGGASGAGVTYFAVSANQQAPSSESASPTTVTVNDPGNATNTTAVAVKSAASVVTISVRDGQSGGSGSGVILDKDGYILTNTHVVTLEGATSNPDVQVATNDGRLFDATIVGTDPIADLAVIKIDADNLSPVEFADSDKLNVGDTAIAIGAPLGLAGTVTDGIISSLNRSITIASSAVPDTNDGEQAPDQNDPQSPFDFWQFDVPGQPQQTPSSSSATISLAVIQTDAAINPGNSGGALLDGDGRLIGINVAIATAGSSSGSSGSIGVGFAIPSNLAKRIAGEIIDTGAATHGLLGASVLDVTDDEDAADSGVVGASIKELVSGGAAEQAGLRVGDVITEVDGIRITGASDLTAQIRAHAAGSKATVTYVRGGKSDEVTLTLGTLKV